MLLELIFVFEKGGMSLSMGKKVEFTLFPAPAAAQLLMSVQISQVQ